MPIKLFFVYLLILFGAYGCINDAHADYVPTKYYTLAYPANGVYYTDYNQACTYFINLYVNAYPSKGYTLETCTSTNIRIRANQANNYDESATTLNQWKNCGQGYVLYSASPSGMCAGTAPPPPCTAGAAGNFGVKQSDGSTTTSLTAGNLNQTSCFNGCETKLTPTGTGWYGTLLTDGSYYVFGDNNYTGATCTASPSSPAPKTEPCPVCDCLKAGKSWGTVNGAVVCVALGSTGSQSVAHYTTNTSTSSTTNNTNNTTTTNNSTTTTSTTYSSGNSVATSSSTTTTGSDGSSVTSNQSGTDTKENFCTQNPNSTMCKGKTACEENPEGPECKHFCEKFPDSVACKKTEDFIKDLVGDPDDIPNEEIGEKEVTIGEDFNFNPVTIQSAEGCPAARTMQIAGATMTVSFDWLCEYASAFKMLVKAFATFIAYGIVAAAIRGDAQPYQRSLF